MTDERIPERESPRDDDRRPGPSGSERDADQDRDRKPQQGQDDSPWLREGADAPDAADIADPNRQR